MDGVAGFSVSVGFDLSGLSTGQVWTMYVALGGTRDERSVERELAWPAGLGRMEHNLLALALNEHFLDLAGGCPVAYRP